MRVLALLAVVAGAIWAAKTGKLKTSKLGELRGRAKNLAGNAADDLGKRADDGVEAPTP
jgi:hypothetical protein